MFFAPPSSSTSQTPSEDDVIIGKKLSEIYKEIDELRESISQPLTSAVEALEDIQVYAEGLNKTFLGTRERLQEMMRTLATAVPMVTRLGGGYKEAAETIAEIAAASRRNVIAQSEDIENLFAAGKLIGKQVKDIVSNFADVGYSYDKISKNVEKSIVYVQSVGQNARQVMGDVLANTDKLARFNFNEGVLGLTKMAAQASRLRFDMKATFEFAEKVLDPDEAVKMAATFQRLGVSIGNLTDPFQLMNQSINDPSGLQDSVINVAKSFTYFDEKTKSFRVSPQGILTLNELGRETGLGAENLRKSALAAAEMDDKLKRINTQGLNLDVTDEDKKMIANVARMGEGGEYEVSIKNETGDEYQKKLVDLQEQDFKNLIKQQREAPKTMEEIQSRQLNTAEKMLAEMRGIKETFKSAFFTMPGVTKNIEDALNIAREGSEALGTSYRQSGAQDIMRGFSEDLKSAQKIKDKDERERKEREIQQNAKDFLSSVAPVLYQNFKNQLETTKGEANQSVIEYFNNLLPMFGGESRERLRRTRRRANGGFVYGEGTADSDSIPTMLSNGEYVVNARAAAMYSPLLESINSLGRNVGIGGTNNENVNIKFDSSAPITVIHKVTADSRYDYQEFNNFLKNAPDSTKETFKTMMSDIALRTGQASKKGTYTFTT